MPKKLVHKKTTADDINTAIAEWGTRAHPLGSAVPPAIPDLGVLHYAIPTAETAEHTWIPSMSDMDLMLSGLRASRAASLATLRISLSSFSLRLSRNRAQMVKLQRRLSALHWNAGDVIPGSEVNHLRRARKSVGTLITYRGWLQVLGVAGVLDADTIAAVASPEYKARLQRMARDLAAAGGIQYEPEFDKPHNRSIAALTKVPEAPRHTMCGKLFVEAVAFERVGSLAPLPWAEFSGNAGALVGYHLTGEIPEGAGRVFVNCILDSVTFTGDLDGAVFIGCEFINVTLSKLTSERTSRAGRLRFQSCEGFFDLSAGAITELWAHDCGDLTLSVRWAQITQSHITDGWITVKRYTKAGEDARHAPRYINNAVWERGGLDFSITGVSVAEIDRDDRRGILRGMVTACVPADVRGAERVMGIDGEAVTGYEAARQLIDEREYTTRALAEYPWQILD